MKPVVKSHEAYEARLEAMTARWPFEPLGVYNGYCFYRVPGGKVKALHAHDHTRFWPSRSADVEPESKLWTIPREQTKADRAHEVPLSPLALEILEALPRFSGPYIFTTMGGERPVSGFSKGKKGLEELSGLTDWRLHDLRRTGATNMARLGVPGSTIGRVLNHAQRGVTAGAPREPARQYASPDRSATR